MASRSVICTVLGHVDHGKSSILDSIRGTAIVASEPGQITQAIGASIIPLDVIRRVCGGLLSSSKLDVSIPGILFIDTPGHEAFTSLRKRGGALADVAVLVVDVNEGFRPQTIESLGILRQSKTPFVVAANKVDLVSGWASFSGSLLSSIGRQPDNVQYDLDNKLYSLVAKLAEFGFNSERFDRVSDYTKQIAIIPTSAKTGDGIPELLMVIAGLAQKFLEKSLSFSAGAPARGTVLEVKKDKGLGTTLDVIVYDGTLSAGDSIVIGGVTVPVVAKVKALFQPAPLNEMRDRKAKFVQVKCVVAATGVKISAVGVDDVLAGMPLVSGDVEAAKRDVQAQVKEVLVETDKNGVIIKADTLGGLEALTRLLKDKGISVRMASIGDIGRKDISEAETNRERDPLTAVVLGFNVALAADVDAANVKVITGNIIYGIIGVYDAWRQEELKRQESRALDRLVRPFKVQLLSGYVFRQSNPAIVGVEVLAGTLRVNSPVTKSGKSLTLVREIQEEGESVSKAERGKRVAVSLDGVTVGRQVNEGDILLSDIPEEHFRELKRLKDFLSEDEREVAKVFAELKRKDSPLWGI